MHLQGVQDLREAERQQFYELFGVPEEEAQAFDQEHPAPEAPPEEEEQPKKKRKRVKKKESAEEPGVGSDSSSAVSPSTPASSKQGSKGHKGVAAKPAEDREPEDSG